jgi:hypothetical protein
VPEIGENPPDPYFLMARSHNAIEISILKQQITDDRGTRFRGKIGELPELIFR